ncbi:unspecified product [Leptomonas pyrrhocoris]|uniref:Unspecified product n=1 Tax=Leptomonas pyrrhocoris TaxID=157538 RepID=A0A0M9FYW1_LEPPY|nr:unspecified product [Leptomonas pyrrhocoris]KPA78960.1 unspecified product [Leptomonas pyrrhocoris]|eukprot:XP_015657399.1 unspecified product [Leptomonas pyrrhocoris]
MGSTQSKIEDAGDNHPARFYDGCAKVQEGCYTVAEIYFNQAIENHPGHAFWTDLMEVTVPKGDRSSDQEESPNNDGERREFDRAFGASAQTRAAARTRGTSVQEGNEGSRRIDGVSADSPRQAAQRIPSLAGDEETDSVTPEEAARAPALVFPVDRRLVDLQDYVRMLSDIARMYSHKADASEGASCDMALKLSMMYNSYTAVRLQTMLHLLQTHFAAHNTAGDAQGEDMFGLYGKSGAQPQSLPPRNKMNMNIKKTAVNGTVNNDVASQDGQDDAVCLFWESVQFFWMSNVVSYVTTALRLMRSSGTSAPSATFKAVFDLSLTCLEAVRTQLASTAEANSHIYIGNLMSGFITFLGNSIKECTESDEGPASWAQRNGRGHANTRAPRDAKAAYLRLGSSPSFADDQVNFFRRAKHFAAPSIPLLDVGNLTTVELAMEFDTHSKRAIVLMTPMDRCFPWYMNVDVRNYFERHAAFPGCSAYLLKMCGVPDDATMRDWRLFAATGLEEMCIILFRMAVITGLILHLRGKFAQSQALFNASTPFALNMYGCRTPISDLVDAQFKQLTDNATM